MSENKTIKKKKKLQPSTFKQDLLGLWRMLEGYRWLYLGALVAIAIGALARTYNYRLIRYVVDDVLGAGAVERLPLLGLAFVGLAAFEGLFAYLRGVWSAKTAEGITQRLRNYLFDHLQRLPFAFHDHNQTGELI